MFLGCSRTRIKACLLSLVNNVNGPAVLFLWGLCVCAAGGSKVGSGEEPRTLGSVGGHWVMLVECTVICWGQTAGNDPADVKRCQSHQNPSVWSHRALRVGGAGTVEQRCWICVPQFLLIVLVWQGKAGAMLWWFTLSLTGSHLLLEALVCPICAGLRRTWVLSL